MLASGVVSWGVALVMVFSIAETTDSVSWSAGKHVAFMGEFLEPTECDSPADGSLVANESRWPDPLRTNALMVASRCKPSPKWVIIHLPATTIRRSITIAVTSCAHLALLMMAEATRNNRRARIGSPIAIPGTLSLSHHVAPGNVGLFFSTICAMPTARAIVVSV